MTNKLRQVSAKKGGRSDHAGCRAVHRSNPARQEDDQQPENEEHQREYPVESHVESENTEHQALCQRDAKITDLDCHPGERDRYAQHDYGYADQMYGHIEGMLMSCSIASQHVH